MLVYTLDSFAKGNKGGNPAGVVIGYDGLTLQQMQSAARIVGFSETVFMLRSSKADYKARFFTPNSEVDLCGHATIAAFSLLSELKLINEGKYTLETMSGILDIEIDKSNSVLMNQKSPEYGEEIDKTELTACFGIGNSELCSELPVQIVSTGLRDIFVPIKSLSALMAIKPDFDKICEISRSYDVIGIHAFTTETIHNSTAHCRNFAPLYGIPEESATGTSNAALACYLWKQNIINASNVDKIIFEQGYCMNKPSEIITKLVIEDNRIEAVKVGGNAVITGKLEISV